MAGPVLWVVLEQRLPCEELQLDTCHIRKVGSAHLPYSEGGIGTAFTYIMSRECKSELQSARTLEFVKEVDSREEHKAMGARAVRRCS